MKRLSGGEEEDFCFEEKSARYTCVLAGGAVFKLEQVLEGFSQRHLEPRPGVDRWQYGHRLVALRPAYVVHV